LLDNNTLYSAGSEGKIRVWDISDGTCVKILNESTSKNVKKDVGSKLFNKTEQEEEDEEDPYSVPI